MIAGLPRVGWLGHGSFFMMGRFKISLVLVAWFMATGAQWDLVQTFGWARMFVNYSRSMPIISAVQRTFDGEMCPLCRAVHEAKQQGNNSAALNGKLNGKMVFIFQPTPAVIFTIPDPGSWSLSDQKPPSAPRSAPPTPPPRIA